MNGWTTDELDPRDQANRYRLYRVRDGQQVCLATSPELAGVTLAMAMLIEEGDLDPEDGIGVLDTHGRADVPGDWLLNPYGAFAP